MMAVLLGSERTARLLRAPAAASCTADSSDLNRWTSRRAAPAAMMAFMFDSGFAAVVICQISLAACCGLKGTSERS